MTKTNALPRPAGATVLSLLAIALAALVLPASSLADPPAGSGPPLVVSPPSLVFEKTTVGNQAPGREVDLYNEGEEEAPIDKIAIEGEDAGAFNINSSSCGAIFQNQHCGLWFTFMPNSPGEKQATIIRAEATAKQLDSSSSCAFTVFWHGWSVARTTCFKCPVGAGEYAS